MRFVVGFGGILLDRPLSHRHHYFVDVCGAGVRVVALRLNMEHANFSVLCRLAAFAVLFLALCLGVAQYFISRAINRSIVSFFSTFLFMFSFIYLLVWC